MFGLVEDINLDGGYVTAPTEPGLGYEIDGGMLRKGHNGTIE